MLVIYFLHLNADLAQISPYQNYLLISVITLLAHQVSLQEHPY